MRISVPGFAPQYVDETPPEGEAPPAPSTPPLPAVDEAIRLAQAQHAAGVVEQPPPAPGANVLVDSPTDPVIAAKAAGEAAVLAAVNAPAPAAAEPVVPAPVAPASANE